MVVCVKTALSVAFPTALSEKAFEFRQELLTMPKKFAH
jgi:hypothetical protein